MRYRCSAEPMLVLHCHCRDCQYASGGDGSTVLVVTDGMSVQEAPASFSVTADSGTTVSRQFCATCGSPLFASSPASPALFVIKAATLDDPSWLTPAAHIRTESAPAWACIPEAILEFPKNFGAS